MSKIAFVKCQNHKKWIKVASRMIKKNEENILDIKPYVVKREVVDPCFSVPVWDIARKKFNQDRMTLGIKTISGQKAPEKPAKREKNRKALQTQFLTNYEKLKQDHVLRNIQIYKNARHHDQFMQNINATWVDELSSILGLSRFEFIQRFYKLRFFIDLYLHEHGEPLKKSFLAIVSLLNQLDSLNSVVHVPTPIVYSKVKADYSLYRMKIDGLKFEYCVLPDNRLNPKSVLQSIDKCKSEFIDKDFKPQADVSQKLQTSLLSYILVNTEIDPLNRL
ncbi:hypothetical protein RF11_06727 [Thelohanellus kitauei]|uniref:Uncharacterized protein n=1 Tax=Thelohanellus kitauei TaxID=669202 RepID=A0A0C2MM41_THEKT|nr:hypothetical protein RF11_06727 [Thelohanellus kitauei]